MQNFMIRVLVCSVTMSALAVIYMALTPFLVKRYSPGGIYYAWLIMVIGLIIPFRPCFDASFIEVTPTDTVMPVVQAGNGMQPAGPMAGVLPFLDSPGTSPAWWPAAVWLAGAAIFLIYHTVKHRRFIKMADRWSVRVTDAETLGAFQSVREELGISKTIGLYRCESIGTPMLVGFVHPRILLPNLAFAEDDLRFILNHELVHYRRGDLWYKSLVLAANAIHWFNPLMYFIVREIDVRCEISCDFEVVKRADADTRQQYSEAIIGVVRYQSKMKTAFSTNFYGGKKGMKKRISSIMDRRSKKTGAALLCGVLVFTVGTGVTFAADREKTSRPNRPEYIDESIVVSPYFVPDPERYAAYSPFGIAISDDGRTLLYQNEKVRQFVDEGAESWAFYYNEAGTDNLSVTRNSSGEITSINTITGEAAQKYYDAFFADDLKEVHTSGNKFDQFTPYGITYSAEDEIIRFQGQRVRLLVDEADDGTFDTFWTDEAGTVNLSVARDSSGRITGIETISKEKAQEYTAAANRNEQRDFTDLEKEIEERVQKLYPNK